MDICGPLMAFILIFTFVVSIPSFIIILCRFTLSICMYLTLFFPLCILTWFLRFLTLIFFFSFYKAFNVILSLDVLFPSMFWLRSRGDLKVGYAGVWINDSWEWDLGFNKED